MNWDLSCYNSTTPGWATKDYKYHEMSLSTYDTSPNLTCGGVIREKAQEPQPKTNLLSVLSGLWEA
jgi:hypothetical protein